MGCQATLDLTAMPADNRNQKPWRAEPQIRGHYCRGIFIVLKDQNGRDIYGPYGTAELRGFTT